MTLDQWQDIVSKMTPEQREAMAAYGEACYDFGVDGSLGAAEDGYIAKKLESLNCWEVWMEFFVIS